MVEKRLTAAEVVERLAKLEMRCLCQCIKAGDAGDEAASHMREAEAAMVSICRRTVEDNLVETPEQSRERFERWQAVAYPGYSRGRYAVTGDYMTEGLQTLWEAWEASRTFRSEQES